MVLLQRKQYFSKDSEGGPTFHRESNFFQGGGGGPNANFYRNPQSSIHGLFGMGGLECTVGLLCSCISANVTELNCTLGIQDVPYNL